MCFLDAMVNHRDEGAIRYRQSWKVSLIQLQNVEHLGLLWKVRRTNEKLLMKQLSLPGASRMCLLNINYPLSIPFYDLSQPHRESELELELENERNHVRSALDLQVNYTARQDKTTCSRK